jgi:hypothetical protein
VAIATYQGIDIMDKPTKEKEASTAPTPFLPRRGQIVTLGSDGKWNITYPEPSTPQPPSIVDFMARTDPERSKFYKEYQDNEYSNYRFLRSDLRKLIDRTNLLDKRYFAEFINIMMRKIQVEKDHKFRHELTITFLAKLVAFKKQNDPKCIVIHPSTYKALQAFLDSYPREAKTNTDRFSNAIQISLYIIELDKSFSSPAKKAPCAAVFDYIVDATFFRIKEHSKQNKVFSVATLCALTSTTALLVNEALKNPNLITPRYAGLLKRLSDMKDDYGELSYKSNNMVEKAKQGLSSIEIVYNDGQILVFRRKPSRIAKALRFASTACKKFRQAKGEMNQRRNPTPPQLAPKATPPEHGL